MTPRFSTRNESENNNAAGYCYRGSSRCTGPLRACGACGTWLCAIHMPAGECFSCTLSRADVALLSAGDATVERLATRADPGDRLNISDT